MRRLALLMVAAWSCLFPIAATVTFDFTSSVPSGWVASVNPNGYEATDRGAQFTSNATLTLKNVGKVSNVTVVCSSNIAGENSVSVSVGGNSFGSEILPKENNMSKVFRNEVAVDGDLVITITRSSKSVYIRSVTIDGVTDIEEKPITDGLDTAYVYSEPTIIVPQDSLGTNRAYSFVQNNIKVECTNGAYMPEYFGCNASGSLTFTATKEITGFAIDGFIKKDFDATISSGEIRYQDASFGEVTANPVLVATDVNSRRVELKCDKQIRCYQIRFYFDTNSEDTLEYAVDDTVTLVFDSIVVLRYSEYDRPGAYDYNFLLYNTDGYFPQMSVNLYSPFERFTNCEFRVDDGTIDTDYSFVMTSEDDFAYFMGGTFRVEKLNGVYAIEASLIGTDHILYVASYTGAITVFDEDSESALGEIAVPGGNGVLYDVMGNAVNAAYRGIVILNGQKYLQK